MSQKPRRTFELVQETSSTTRSSRISRIAQPRRTSGARCLDQRMSSDPSIQPIKNLFVSSKTQRSSSATPQRTPLRLKTPTRQMPVTQQATNEKKSHDKNFISNESARISENLKVIESELGKEFFDRGGIKNMSTKQFIIIVNYFLKLIAGNRFSLGNNYVESMAKVLNEIGYPYTVAKSWLKTPTAPHAFHNIILLFNWFLTFLPYNPLVKPIDHIESYENIYVSENKDFPDKEYACNFVRQSREIFSAWNNGLDKVVEEAKLKLANDMILKVCDINGLNDLECKINDLLIEDDEIQSNLKEDSRIEEYNRLDADYKYQIKEMEKYKKCCKSNAKEIKETKSQIDSKEKLVKSFAERIEKIKIDINNQKINVKERDNFLRQINALSHELKVKADNVLQLQEEGSKNQILFSRLINRKTALVTKINTYIYNLFTEIKVLNSFEFNEISLNKDCEIEDIEQVKIISQQISKKLINDITRIENKIEKLEKLSNHISTEDEKILKPTLEEYKKQLDTLSRNLKEIDELLLINLNENYKNEEFINTKIKDVMYSRNQLVNELQIKTEKLNKLKDSNMISWNSFENKMDAFLAYREQKLNSISEAVHHFEVTMRGFPKMQSKGNEL